MLISRLIKKTKCKRVIKSLDFSTFSKPIINIYNLWEDIYQQSQIPNGIILSKVVKKIERIIIMELEITKE
jgi:hypothetical protein